MLRFSHICAVALTLGGFALVAGPLQAAPITMDASSPSGFAQDLIPSLEDLSDPLLSFPLVEAIPVKAAAAKPVAENPKPQPKPPPKRPAPVQVEQQVLVTLASATTMSGGPSVTTGSPVPATLVAVFTPAPDLSPEPDGSLLCFSEWIFVPPRFLDGVFRPPRNDDVS